jgi:hypothetical protein
LALYAARISNVAAVLSLYEGCVCSVGFEPFALKTAIAVGDVKNCTVFARAIQSNIV